MASSSHIHFDDSLWPLLIIRYVGTPTNQEFAESLERRTRYLERGERHALLFDLSQTSGMGPSEQRHMQVAWMKKHDARSRELVVGAAFVAHSPMVRLLLSLILHLQPIGSPYIAAMHMSEAVAWMVGCLRQAGMHAAALQLRNRFGLAALSGESGAPPPA